MSFVSRLDTVFRKLRERLDLQDIQTEQVFIPSTIIPVLEIGELIGVNQIKSSGAISITATGSKTMLTVPQNKRWVLHGITAYRSTGTWTFDQIYINDGTSSFWLKTIAASLTTQTTEILGHPIALEAGWLLGINIDSYTGTGNAILAALITEESLA